MSSEDLKSLKKEAETMRVALVGFSKEIYNGEVGRRLNAVKDKNEIDTIITEIKSTPEFSAYVSASIKHYPDAKKYFQHKGEMSIKDSLTAKFPGELHDREEKLDIEFWKSNNEASKTELPFKLKMEKILNEHGMTSKFLNTSGITLTPDTTDSITSKGSHVGGYNNPSYGFKQL